jgi:hypothetical protein
MNNQRRNVLRLTSVIALMASTGLITNAQAAEWNKAAFEGKNLDDVLKAIGGSKPETSADIIMRAPDIAENGAVVPVGVETNVNSRPQDAGCFSFRYRIKSPTYLPGHRACGCRTTGSRKSTLKRNPHRTPQ